MLLQRRLRMQYNSSNTTNEKENASYGSNEKADLVGLGYKTPTVFFSSSNKQGTGDKDLDDLIQLAGYSYDQQQDIFFSLMDPWQRDVGYCRFYDESAAPLGMIIDCEPIYFECGNRKWMISFWKGQYDMVTGAEIGVYTDGTEVNIPSVFKGTFYNTAKDDERLDLSFVLKKNGKELFRRSDNHWWLTGFRLGEFSQPDELTMEIKLTLLSKEMLDAFLKSFLQVGYHDHEFTVEGNTVSFTFGTPYSKQPFTRNPETDKIIQDKNLFLCDLYCNLTKNDETMKEKLNTLKKEAPELYSMVLKLGKKKKMMKFFYNIMVIVMALIPFFPNKRVSI